MSIKYVSDQYDESILTEFLTEGLMMKEFNHRNILSLIGLTILGSQPCVILPFMENGDLNKYLRKQTKIGNGIEVSQNSITSIMR